MTTEIFETLKARTVSLLLCKAKKLGLDSYDAEVLLLCTLGHSWFKRIWLRLHADDIVSNDEETRFLHFCQLRLNDVPVSYLIGEREFYGLTLRVDNRVLVPRPDTESLVDWAFDVLQDTVCPRVLDLGTGSGAIALAIKSQRNDAAIWASDASNDALDVARANAVGLGLPIQFLHGSWLLPLLNVNNDRSDVSQPPEAREAQAAFDLIVSNPPYIAEGDPHLPALTHEPIGALTSGPDGLRDIRQIVQQSPACLKAGGWLLLEHGHDQAGAVTDILRTGGFTHIQSRKDLAGIERCTGGQWLPVSRDG